MLRDRGERLEYIRNSSTTHCDERFSSATIQAWIVELTDGRDDLDVRMAIAAEDLLGGTVDQWENCVALWALESEVM
jgi:hypothetical protein